MKYFLSIGEIMLEMASVGDDLYRRGFAGDSFNVAYYMRKILGDGPEIDYLTALGRDDVSRECIEHIRRNGVGVDSVRRLDERTVGLFVLSNDAQGEKRYNYWRGQSAARRLFDQKIDISGYKTISLSGITIAITENRQALYDSLSSASQAGSSIVFDYNYRPLLWSSADARAFCDRVIGLSDIVKISDEELSVIYDDLDFAALTMRAPAAEWVLTRGGHGAETWRAGERVAALTADPLRDVVDSSAAGDAFLAAYLAARLGGATAERALASGHAIARQVVMGKGSIVDVDLSQMESS